METNKPERYVEPSGPNDKSLFGKPKALKREGRVQMGYSTKHFNPRGHIKTHICRHITSPHITSPHIASHRIASHHIASHRLTSHRLTSHRLTSPHIASPHIASPHIASQRLTTPHNAHAPAQKMTRMT